MGITFNGRTYLEALEEKQRFEQLGLGNWESFMRQLARHQQLIRQLSFPADEVAKLARMGLVTDQAFRQSAELRKALQRAALPPGIAESSHRVVEDLRRAAAQLRPLMDAYGKIGQQLAETIERHNKVLRNALAHSPLQQALQTFLDEARAIERINLTLPKIAPATWPPDILGPRLGLIEDALKNVSVWHNLREETVQRLANLPWPWSDPETLDIAGQFVFDHGLFIRRLPPSIPSDEAGRREEEEFRHRDEEVGAKLETGLARLDAELLDLRRGAWENMVRGGAGGVRLAAAGARELFTEVLHRLSPDEELKKTDMWQQRSDKSLTKPTRSMRIEFIVGAAAREFDMLVQFDKCMEHAHKFTHSFADNPEVVRVFLSQLENCTYLLLIYAKSRKSQH